MTVTHPVAERKDVVHFLGVCNRAVCSKMECGRQQDRDHGDDEQRRVELCHTYAMSGKATDSQISGEVDGREADRVSEQYSPAPRRQRSDVVDIGETLLTDAETLLREPCTSGEETHPKYEHCR